MNCPSLAVLLFCCLVSCHGALMLSDMRRAATVRPRDEYRGHGHTDMANTLNKHLLATYEGFQHRPCIEWNTTELEELQEIIFGMRHPQLDEVYQKNYDNRRLRFQSLEALQTHWAQQAKAAAGNTELEAVRRDGHCHEAVMWLVHHLPSTQETTQALSMVVTTVPLLPPTQTEDAAVCKDATDEAAAKVCVHAVEQDTCAWCHDLANQTQKIPNALDPKYNGPDDGDAACMAKHAADGQAWQCGPHAWDRVRRCDQDYHPRCGLCEGIGGIAKSDKNDDIRIVPCQVVANASAVDPATVHRPVQPTNFSVAFPGYNEVLIGRKTDPFCFQFFPGNNASGTLCYREEMATWYYNIAREATLFDYKQVHMPVAPFSLMPNISSKVYHVGRYMWIVNRLWGGVEQCVCTDPGKSMHDHNYPARGDFAQHAQYLGREKLHVEYIWQDMELDHFILWAHHLWTDPKTGHIVRMWKPYNGLQTIDPAAWTIPMAPSDEALLDVPPAACKKGGGAAFRITCDDDGNYHPKGQEGETIMSQMLAAARGAGHTV